MPGNSRRVLSKTPVEKDALKIQIDEASIRTERQNIRAVRQRRSGQKPIATSAYQISGACGENAEPRDDSECGGGVLGGSRFEIVCYSSRVKTSQS